MAISRELFDSALALHRAGDLQAAARLYRRILEEHPDEPDALNLLAAIDMEAGRHAAAAGLLRRAIAASAEVSQYHCNLGNALHGAGDLPGAAAAYRRAIDLDPGDADAHNGLGFALARLGKPAEAVACFRAALAISPEHFFALNNLGDALSEQGDLDGAVNAYTRALEAAPGVGEVHAKLGAVLKAQGQPSRALEHLWAVVDSGEADALAYGTLGSVLRHALPAAYEPVLEGRVLAFFAADGVDHTDAVDFATALLKLKHAGADDFGSRRDPAFVVDTLLTDPLARALLTRSVCGDGDLEKLLVRARRWLLLEAGSAETSRDAVSVLAQQCLANEFVYPVEADERARLETLRTAIDAWAVAGARPDPALEWALLKLCLYELPAGLPGAASLAAVPMDSWDVALRPLLLHGLFEPLEEAAIAATIPSAGHVRDTVSRAVKAQYEENPYPRWTTPAYRTPANLHRILAGMFPGFEPPEILRGPVRVLVAGCGTGHHPISVAMRYANAEVIATDISRRSLAYGVRKARELGVANVRFVENDLLELGALDGEFHVIECVGVLHHTRSIQRGLQVLLGKLHADGLMKIGLYSRRAREPVALARRRIAELGLTADADDIRRFRHAVLDAPEGDPVRGILEYGDFYTLSNCRDLLFHVHEHEVTIPEIRDLLRAANLAFIGFETADATIAEAYRRRFPGDSSMGDLSRWAEVEDEVPEMFAGLYQFWCMGGAAA